MFICVGACRHICHCTTCMPTVSTEARWGCRTLEIGITESCELQCGCWESSLGPVEEQPVVLTAKPSLQPWYWFINPRLICVFITDLITIEYLMCGKPCARHQEGPSKKSTVYQLLITYKECINSRLVSYSVIVWPGCRENMKWKGTFPLWGSCMENFTQTKLIWLRGEIYVYRGGVILAKRTLCAKKQEQGNGKFKELKGSYYDWRLSVKGQVTRCETGELPLLRHLELIPKGKAEGIIEAFQTGTWHRHVCICGW